MVPSLPSISVLRLSISGKDPGDEMREVHKLAASMGANCLFTPLSSLEEVSRLMDSDLVQRLVLVKSTSDLRESQSGQSIRPLVARLLRLERLRLHEVGCSECVASNFHLWFPPNTNDMSPS